MEGKPFGRNHYRFPFCATVDHMARMVTAMDGRFYLSHLAQRLSRTSEEKYSLMEIHTAHAQPMGSLIFEGHHKPFHALACPLNPQAVRIAKKK